MHLVSRRSGLRIRVAAATVLLLSVSAESAMLHLEDFDDAANGWDTRDGEMSVAYNGGSEQMEGSFASQVFPVSQTDAFRIDTGTDSGGNFTGDFSGNGLTQISFDLYAFNVLPSDLFIRIIDGANTFSYQFMPMQAAGIGFETFTISLDWDYGWSGAGESAFDTALTSVDAVEIQISRSGIGAQSYYLDNIQTLDTEIEDNPGGGGGGSVPEPTTVNLMLAAAGGLALLRRMLRSA